MIIYRVINIISGKSYIGKSVVPLRKRKNRHLKDARNGSHLYFHRAIRKYGKSKFKWMIICVCKSKNALKKKEIYFIKKYHTYLKNNGYNLTYGGDGGIIKHTRATKEKIRLSKLGNKNPMYGKTHSTKVKLDMSKARSGKGNNFYGKKHRPKTILKMKENHIGMLGRKHTDLTKRRMGISARGEHNSQSKLTLKSVKIIKRMIKKNRMFLKDIAHKFSVSTSLIRLIKSGNRWAWVG